MFKLFGVSGVAVYDVGNFVKYSLISIERKITLRVIMYVFLQYY